MYRRWCNWPKSKFNSWFSYLPVYTSNPFMGNYQFQSNWHNDGFMVHTKITSGKGSIYKNPNHRNIYFWLWNHKQISKQVCWCHVTELYRQPMANKQVRSSLHRKCLKYSKSFVWGHCFLWNVSESLQCLCNFRTSRSKQQSQTCIGHDRWMDTALRTDQLGTLDVKLMSTIVLIFIKLLLLLIYQH